MPVQYTDSSLEFSIDRLKARPYYPGMGKGAVVFLLAGLWELIRFVALFLSAMIAPAAIPNAHLNVLWIAAPALVLTALFFAAAFHPDYLRAYVPILRIGAVVAVISDVAVVITGSYDWTVASPTFTAGRLLFGAAFAVLIFDLLLLSYLIAFRHPDTTGDGQDHQVDERDLPKYDPTELGRE